MPMESRHFRVCLEAAGRLGIIGFASAFLLLVPFELPAAAQGVAPRTAMPWDYPADIREPTNEEYAGLIERFDRAMALRREQNWAAAAALFRQDLALKQQTYGPNHPVTGIALFSLAGTLDPAGGCAEAEGLMVEAIRIARSWMEEQNTWYAVAYNILGSCQGQNGKRALAEMSFRRAIEIAEAAGDERQARIARENLASMNQFYEQRR